MRAMRTLCLTSSRRPKKIFGRLRARQKPINANTFVSPIRISASSRLSSCFVLHKLLRSSKPRRLFRRTGIGFGFRPGS
jgi:hypothetical protein